jgi:hypothetical protein
MDHESLNAAIFARRSKSPFSGGLNTERPWEEPDLTCIPPLSKRHRLIRGSPHQQCIYIESMDTWSLSRIWVNGHLPPQGFGMSMSKSIQMYFWWSPALDKKVFFILTKCNPAGPTILNPWNTCRNSCNTLWCIYVKHRASGFGISIHYTPFCSTTSQRRGRGKTESPYNLAKRISQAMHVEDRLPKHSNCLSPRSPMKEIGFRILLPSAAVPVMNRAILRADCLQSAVQRSKEKKITCQDPQPAPSLHICFSAEHTQNSCTSRLEFVCGSTLHSGIPEERRGYWYKATSRDGKTLVVAAPFLLDMLCNRDAFLMKVLLAQKDIKARLRWIYCLTRDTVLLVSKEPNWYVLRALGEGPREDWEIQPRLEQWPRATCETYQMSSATPAVSWNMNWSRRWSIQAQMSIVVY